MHIYNKRVNHNRTNIHEGPQNSLSHGFNPHYVR